MVKKKLLIIGVVVALALAIPSGIVLAVNGVNGFEAFVEALKYGLKGLEEYFKFIIELFKAAVA